MCCSVIPALPGTDFNRVVLVIMRETAQIYSETAQPPKVSLSADIG